MKSELQKKIYDCSRSLYPEANLTLNEIDITNPPEQFGDYTCNVAMKLSGKLKKQPMEIAEQLKEEILQNSEDFEQIVVARPGFLNFHISKKKLQALVKEINEKKQAFGNSSIGQGKKIHLDFVSANPTGPVHLGNGRGGPYGDTLANVFEKAGFKPWREYYVNDYGNQVKVLGHSVLKDDKAEYRGDYIDDLHKRIKETDPFKAGQEAAKIIVEELIRPSMEKLGIKFDEYFSERSLHESAQVEKVHQKFQEQGLIYENEGALWFKASEFGDEKDRVVRKSTGEITYFGGDIAYHQNKFERGFDLAIDIWGADHHGDVKRVMGAVEALGHKGKLKIILTQLMKIMKDSQEMRMSKRKGLFVTMDDLIEEVGKDAVRFFFLLYSNDTHMVFDLNLAKEQSDKNPVFYVQYAHARICSIFKKAEELGFAVATEASLALLTHEKELSLIKHLNRFPELIEEVAQSYEVHKLPYYAKELSDRFHSFYHDCKVLDDGNRERSQARLQLVQAARIVLAESLRLIGVVAPERM